MTLQVSSIVLAVQDLKRAKEFYSEGLGCPIAKDHEAHGFVSFNLGAGSEFALYSHQAFTADSGVTLAGSGFSGATFHYIVTSPEVVDEVLAQAQAAGGKIVRPAQKAQWGGYYGYFTDLDGYFWKVAASA